MCVSFGKRVVRVYCAALLVLLISMSVALKKEKVRARKHLLHEPVSSVKWNAPCFAIITILHN